MSKRTDREDKVTDRLERENRELKSLVKGLQKRLKRETKGQRISYKNASKDEPLEPIKSYTPTCPECAKGELIFKEVFNRSWQHCSVCEYRTKTIIQ